jgi:DNA-binding transcriptional MerR regulator
LTRLSFVRRAPDLGFSLDQVRALLDLAGQGQRDCGSVDVLASAHLAEIDRKHADLTALRNELSAFIASCHGGMIKQCRILEALAPRS